MKDIVLEINGISRTCLIKHKPSRRISLSLGSENTLNVRIPRFLSYSKAEKILRKEIRWVRGVVAKMLARIERSREFLGPRGQYSFPKAEEMIKRRVNELCLSYGFIFNKLRVKEMKSRWGSCSHGNNISINAKIYLLSGEMADYIMLHELMHTRIKDHGRRFWGEMERIMPGAKKIDRTVSKIHPAFI